MLGLSSLLTSCINNKSKHIFTLDEDAFKIIENNVDCIKLFSNNFGEKETDSYGHAINGMILKLKDSKKVNYERLILINLKESGEVITTTRISIRVFSNNTTLISVHKKDTELSERTIKSFNIDNFYKKLGSSQEDIKGARKKLLIIDFESNESCECKFYRDISSETVKQLKDLTFFE